jgi:hypothetical protein
MSGDKILKYVRYGRFENVQQSDGFLPFILSRSLLSLFFCLTLIDIGELRDEQCRIKKAI